MRELFLIRDIEFDCGCIVRILVHIHHRRQDPVIITACLCAQVKRQQSSFARIKEPGQLIISLNALDAPCQNQAFSGSCTGNIENSHLFAQIIERYLAAHDLSDRCIGFLPGRGIPGIKTQSVFRMHDYFIVQITFIKPSSHAGKEYDRIL